MDKIKNILGLTLLGAILVFASANATISNPPTVATVDTSTLVPYTGADQSVDLGANAITADNLFLGADIQLGHGSNLLNIIAAGVAKTGAFDLSSLTDDRAYVLPDAAGTVALTSDIDVTKATNYKTIQWSASYASSTSQFDDVMFTFKNDVIIDNVYVTSRDAANTVSWNLLYSTDPTTATSSAFKLFSSTQTTTSTPTSARNLTTFASSTPSAGMTLRMYSAVASSSLTTWTIYYHEN